MKAKSSNLIKSRGGVLVVSGGTKKDKDKFVNELAKSHAFSPWQILQFDKGEEKTYKVEQIRTLVVLISQTAMNQRLFVIIQDLDDANSVCQSALLKTLEEYANRVIFVIFVKNKNALLATLLSRASVIDLTDTNDLIGSDISSECNFASWSEFLQSVGKLAKSKQKLLDFLEIWIKNERQKLLQTESKEIALVPWMRLALQTRHRIIRNNLNAELSIDNLALKYFELIRKNKQETTFN